MCFPSDTRYLYASIRSVRIALCERFVCFYTKCSHRLMREVRIVLYEIFVSPYTRYAVRSNRDVGYARDKHFIQDWRDSLSNAGEILYPMQDKPIIQVERRAVKRLCLLKPVLRLHLSELLVFDRAFHNFFVDFLFAVFFNKSRIF